MLQDETLKGTYHAHFQVHIGFSTSTCFHASMFKKQIYFLIVSV